MVQEMVDAQFNEYIRKNRESNESGLANNATGIPTHDRQPTVSSKKTALRDLPNKNQNIIPKPQNDTPVKEKGHPEDITVCGNKRPTPDRPPIPTCSLSSFSNVKNSHIVYVRRKAEAEAGKINGCNVENENVLQSMKSTTEIKHEMPEQEIKHAHLNTAFLSTFPVTSFPPFSSGETSAHSIRQPVDGLRLGQTSTSHSFRKPVNGLVVAESIYPTLTTAVPFTICPQNQKSRIHQWQQRFDQLQAFLKSCDDSNQEEFVRMLRSISAVGHSRHAIELEKRAIHLSLEEGKEFQRVMYLNVLGSSVPRKYSSSA